MSSAVATLPSSLPNLLSVARAQRGRAGKPLSSITGVFLLSTHTCISRLVKLGRRLHPNIATYSRQNA